MQVKKFEAPTIQEALENIKRELGPEAIILHTKKHRKGFGLMGNGSVEITAAVSERAIVKKGLSESRIPADAREKIRNLPADKQAEVYDKQMDRMLSRKAAETQDRVDLGARASVRGAAARAAEASSRNVTRQRYVDIDPEDRPVAAQASAARAALDAAVRASEERAPRPVAATTAPALRPRTQSGTMTLEQEVAHLKRMMVEMKETSEAAAPQGGNLGQGSLFTPALEDAFEQLTLAGVEKRNALNLVRKVGFELGQERAAAPEQVLDQLASEIMDSLRVRSSLNGLEPRSQTGKTGAPEVLALVGSTGVGKTTTIAKLASEAILRRNLKVGLINLDSYKVAAFDQLATYAKILNVPFRSAQSAEDLKAALGDFKSLDLVIIDTTGRSQRDPKSLQEMQELLGAVEGIRTQLVVSATTRDAELLDMASRFSVFRPEGILFSKLDEATCFGSIYNLSQKVNLPLTYFTTGQRVPEDIEEASVERIAALILEL